MRACGKLTQHFDPSGYLAPAVIPAGIAIADLLKLIGVIAATSVAHEAYELVIRLGCAAALAHIQREKVFTNVLYQHKINNCKNKCGQEKDRCLKEASEWKRKKLARLDALERYVLFFCDRKYR